MGDVGVSGNDHRRVSAELHRCALHMGARERGELFSHRCRTGECDFSDHRVRYQVVADFGRVSVDQRHHACGNASVDKGPHQLSRRCRGFLGGLDDDRAAGCQRAAHLAHHLVDREIPGREGCHRADRLLHDHLLYVHGPRRHQTAVDPTTLVGEPLDDVAGHHDFHLRFGQRLTLFQGHQPRGRVAALAQQLGRSAHQLGAFDGRGVAPDLEAPRGRCERVVEVGDAGARDRSDGLAGSRVVDHQGGVAARRAPLVVDQELHVRIGHDGVPEIGRLGVLGRSPHDRVRQAARLAARAQAPIVPQRPSRAAHQARIRRNRRPQSPRSCPVRRPRAGVGLAATFARWLRSEPGSARRAAAIAAPSGADAMQPART